VEKEHPMRFLSLLVVALIAAGPVACSGERILFDTDIGGDIDDAGTMAVLHALADAGEIEILGIGVVNGHENTVPYTDAINTWFGRPDLPVGTIKEGAPFRRDTYMADVVRDYPHDLNAASAPDAVALYRRILAAQPDHSVTLAAVGPATNMCRLLESKPDTHSPLSGVELVRQKVKLYAAGGNGDGGLPKGRCGWNYRMDIPAAKRELELLPDTFPTVFAGGSGNKLKIGSCYKDAPANHIIRRSYEAYFRGKPDLDRPTWDQLRVLYAARPSARELFDVSAFGDIAVSDPDRIAWAETPARNRAYAYVKDLDAMRKMLTTLMMHAPAAVKTTASQAPAAAPATPAAAVRPAAPWPPPAGAVRVIVDTDTANEIDDQYALAAALGFPERLRIEGLVAAHFGDPGGGAKGIGTSHAEAVRVLEKAGRAETIPVKRGVDRLVAGAENPTSDGIDFIIERAMASTPEDPLWLVLLGPATDAVVALRKEPKIAERMVVFWHVRSEWPKRCRNFNAKNDPEAARLIFELPSRLVLFDTGTDLHLRADASERRYGGIGPLGRYLADVHKARFPDKDEQSKGKAVFDLGDTAALVDPACVKWERVQAPGVTDDLTYDFTRKNGEVVRIHSVDKARSFDLLEQALRALAGGAK
jgi:inosine-uridine nucleoside N-ribohydrolase